MSIIWLSEVEKERLLDCNTLDLEQKLLLINLVNKAVNLSLQDYIHNEEFCVQWEVPSLPQSRVYKLDEVYRILQSKTAREIITILDDWGVKIPQGTNKNRKFFLKKFGLWTGEGENFFEDI